MMRKNIPGMILMFCGILLLLLSPFLIKTARTRQAQNPTPETEDMGHFETRGEYRLDDDQVVLAFALYNHHAEAKTLQFGSGQQFEVVVKNEDDEEVYRYSDGKFFTMALVDRRIEPGAALHWEDRWDRRDREGKKVSPGRYRAEIEIIVIPTDGGVTIERQQLRTSVEFTLPDDGLGAADGHSTEKTGQAAVPSTQGSRPAKRIKGAAAEGIIGALANEVMLALRAQDGASLARFVHPEKGVRFTPYTYVQPERDLVFTPEQIRHFFDDQTVYHWGYYDGTGDEINLTPGEYYQRFIYSADFINAEQIGYNEVLSAGNMLENQFEVYAQPIIVEYYFSGFNPEYMGLDWQSLRLVFEEDDDGWKLTGIIHNEWTI